MYLEELAVIHDSSDHFVHIVSTVGRVRDDFVEKLLAAVSGIVASNEGWLLHVVLWQEGE